MVFCFQFPTTKYSFKYECLRTPVTYTFKVHNRNQFDIECRLLANCVFPGEPATPVDVIPSSQCDEENEGVSCSYNYRIITCMPFSIIKNVCRYIVNILLRRTTFNHHVQSVSIGGVDPWNDQRYLSAKAHGIDHLQLLFWATISR